MMNLTNAEEKELYKNPNETEIKPEPPKAEPEPKTMTQQKVHEQYLIRKRVPYHVKLFCPLAHELTRIYSRKFGKGALKKIQNLFYCETCDKIFKMEINEVPQNIRKIKGLKFR